MPVPVSIIPGQWNHVVSPVFVPSASVDNLHVRFTYQPVGGGIPPAAEDVWFDANCCRLGSDGTFFPSLDIVGTLDETINPPDMPIVYVKGSPLTVGAGWAGDGYEYTRRDGVGGPIVAQFLPDDLP